MATQNDTESKTCSENKNQHVVTGAIVALILAAGSAGVYMLHASHQRQIADLQTSHRNEQHQASEAVRDKVDRSFLTMYHGLRTMARMPGVRAMHSKDLEPNAKQAIQELYNNLGSEVAMSEVYVVPKELDADAPEGSPAPKEPWITFDELIVGPKPEDSKDTAKPANTGAAVAVKPEVKPEAKVESKPESKSAAVPAAPQAIAQDASTSADVAAKPANSAPEPKAETKQEAVATPNSDAHGGTKAAPTPEVNSGSTQKSEAPDASESEQHEGSHVAESAPKKVYPTSRIDVDPDAAPMAKAPSNVAAKPGAAAKPVARVARVSTPDDAPSAKAAAAPRAAATKPQAKEASNPLLAGGARLGAPKPLATRPPSARQTPSGMSAVVKAAIEAAPTAEPEPSKPIAEAPQSHDAGAKSDVPARSTHAEKPVVAAAPEEAAPSEKAAAKNAQDTTEPAPASAAKVEEQKEIAAKPETKVDEPAATATKKNDTKPEAVAQTEADAKTDVKPDARAEATSDAKSDTKSDAKPETKGDVKPDAKPDAKPADDKPEEIEIYEYRLMKKQLAWLGAHYPTLDTIDGLKFPVVSGEKVITCDNSRYDAKKPNDEDRSGFVVSVPYYNEEGKFAGCVSGVMLAHAVRDMLPSGNFAVLHTATNTTVEAHKPEQTAVSKAAVAKAEADSSLIYSEALKMEFPDATGNWVLWSGQNNSTFAARADVVAATSLYRIGVGAIVGFSLLLSAAAVVVRLRSQKLEKAFRDQEVRVETVLNAVAAAAAGDLSSTLAVTGTDGVGRLAHAFGELITKFRAMIHQMSDMSARLVDVGSTLNENSKLLSAASLDTDRQTQGAVANTGEMAEAVRDLSQSLENLHVGATEIARAAAESIEISNRASSAAVTATDTVSALNKSSAEIANVLVLIRDIADRTNLLALNAAIEAARAGEAGRGFAVVASEVTKLASQTNEAVSGIEARIKTTRKDSEQATNSVKGVRDILSQIDGHQKSIGSAVAEQKNTSARMAAAATEAATTMDRISTTLTGVADAAQRNAKAATQVTAATTKVAGVSTELSDLFRKFRT